MVSVIVKRVIIRQQNVNIMKPTIPLKKITNAEKSHKNIVKK